MTTLSEVIDAPVQAEPTDQPAEAPAVSECKPDIEGDCIPLTEGERKELEACEKQIGRLREAAFATGSALRTIQEQKLYREEFRSFERYCEAKWKMSAQNAYRCINAAKIIGVLKESHQVGDKDLPTCESHVRPLVDGLEEDQWLSAWEQVIEEADGEAPTGTQVKKVVNRINGKTTRKSEARINKSSKGLRSVMTLIGQAKERAQKDKQKAMITLLKKIEEKIKSFLKSSKT